MDLRDQDGRERPRGRTPRHPHPRPLAWLTTAAIALVAATGIGCGGDLGQPPDVVVAPAFDPPVPDLGFDDPVPAATPRRIVSLIPSCTEVLFALGLGDRVIGVDRWADAPAATLTLPRLGDHTKVQTEAVLDLRPDLVLMFQGQDDAAAVLRKAGLRVVQPATMTDAIPGIRELAGLLGVEARGERLVEHIEASIAEVRARVETRPRRRVLVVFERHPQMSVATKSSFFHDILADAGASSVSAEADSERPWTYVSLETVLDWAPDVIIDLSVGDTDQAATDVARAFWLRVCRRGEQVFLVHAPVLARPGPRVGAVADFLAGLIHGR